MTDVRTENEATVRELKRAILALRHGYSQSYFDARAGREHPQKTAVKKALAALDLLVREIEETRRERDAYRDRESEVNVERQRQEVRAIEAERENDMLASRLRDAPLGGDGSHWVDCWRSHIDCAVARVEKAERESERLREALRRHGVHSYTCRLTDLRGFTAEQMRGLCNCGLDAALAGEGE